jgi:hypothetical protein
VFDWNFVIVYSSNIFSSQIVIETGFCPSTSPFVLALGFGPSTSVVARIFRFLKEYFGFYIGTSFLSPSARFLSEYTDFSLFVSFLCYIILMFLSYITFAKQS